MRATTALTASLGLLVGCSAGALDEGFEESFTRGYSCGESWVVLADDNETIRLQASFQDWSGEVVPEDARLTIFTGARLVRRDSDPCDDVINVPLLGEQHIQCRYDQVSGSVTSEIDADSIALVTEGVTLTPTSGYESACDSHPDVVMADGPLLAVRL